MKKRCDIFELVIGVLLFILGIFILFDPGFALKGLVVLFGFVALILGILDIVMYCKVAKFTGFGPMMALITGILSTMCGISLILYPSSCAFIIAIVFPIWFISHAISRLAHLSSFHSRQRPIIYYLMVIINILCIIVGILMILDPYMSLLSVNIMISMYLILVAIEMIVSAFSEDRYYRL